MLHGSVNSATAAFLWKPSLLQVLIEWPGTKWTTRSSTTLVSLGSAGGSPTSPTEPWPPPKQKRTVAKHAQDPVLAGFDTFRWPLRDQTSTGIRVARFGDSWACRECGAPFKWDKLARDHVKECPSARRRVLAAFRLRVLQTLKQKYTKAIPPRGPRRCAELQLFEKAERQFPGPRWLLNCVVMDASQLSASLKMALAGLPFSPGFL